LDQHGAAAADADTNPHTYAEPDSVDLANSVRVADTDSHVQRDTFAHVATVDSSHFRVPDADAKWIT
jgi:hypothetical protein